MKKYIFWLGRIIFFLILISTNLSAQETHGNRIITYNLSIDGLKFQEQEKAIESTLSTMDGVQSCNIDSINYTMVVVVAEDNESFVVGVDEIKAVLLDNRVEIKTIKRTIK